MTQEESLQSQARRRKLFVYADQIGLDDETRIEFTQYMLRRDITSWKQLDDAQVLRMLDALEGFLLLNHLLTEQRPHRGVAESTGR